MPLMLAILLGLILWTGPGQAGSQRIPHPAGARVRRRGPGLRGERLADRHQTRAAQRDRRDHRQHHFTMSAAVVLEAALSFLGFGVSEPNVSLGKLISDYQAAFITRPWLFWWPGLFIILIALSINFIGDGLRDAFDPRTKKIPSQRQMEGKADALLAEGGRQVSTQGSQADEGRKGGRQRAGGRRTAVQEHRRQGLAGRHHFGGAQPGRPILGEQRLVHRSTGLTYDLAAGEVLAIVGESGSGKTQSAMSLIGLLPKNGRATGSAKLKGTELIGMNSRQLQHVRGNEISVIFQEPMTALNPVYTVGFQIVETLRAHFLMQPATGDSPGPRPDAAGGDPRRRRQLQQVPAPTLRRSAAADHDRAGVGV